MSPFELKIIKRKINYHLSKLNSDISFTASFKIQTKSQV